MKTWVLTIYLLSSGLYSETHISAVDCNDALIEATLVRGMDLWSGVCTGPDDEVTAEISGSIGP